MSLRAIMTELDSVRPSLTIIDNTSDVILQAVDWHAEDSENFDSDLDNADEGLDTRYVITAYGVTADGNSITIDIYGFRPCFYVEIPDGWSRTTVDRVMKEVKKRVRCEFALKSYRIVKRKKMAGFNNNKEFKFIELLFYTRKAVSDFVRNIETPMKIFGVDGSVSLKTWESNIDPLLRFMHIQDLSPAGWLRLPAKKYEISDINRSLCQISLTTVSEEVYPCDKEGVAPIITASFDIEADSSHGDFPVAQKTYRKLAWDLSNYYHLMKKARDLSSAPPLHELLQLAFEEEDNEIGISRVYAIRNPTTAQIDAAVKTIEKESLLSNLTMLKSLKADKAGPENVSILHRGETFNAGIERYMARLTVVLDNCLPKVKGDRVIQIGTTFTKYGDPSFSIRHVIALDECDAIDDTIVEWCPTEKDVLLAWTRLIQKVDPDVVIGERGSCFCICIADNHFS